MQDTVYTEGTFDPNTQVAGVGTVWKTQNESKGHHKIFHKFTNKTRAEYKAIIEALESANPNLKSFDIFTTSSHVKDILEGRREDSENADMVQTIRQLVKDRQVLCTPQDATMQEAHNLAKRAIDIARPA